jgi:AsmA protein
LQELNLVVPPVGSITGEANIGPTGQLNCKMAAKLGSSGNAMNVATSALGSLTGGGAKGGGIPFKITGTTSNPVFAPDFGGMAQGAAGTPKNAAGAAQGILGGLLKKKKNQ